MAADLVNKILIVIPTFNESENLPSLVDTIFSYVADAHILVIDDSSPDGTQDVVKQCAAKFPNQVFLKVRPGKQGLGTAYVDGFMWALERFYDYVIQMDADHSHDPSTLPQFLDVLQVSDAVLGSRYIKGGRIVNWSYFRKFISRFGSLYARLWLGMPILDMTGGFNGWRRAVLSAVDIEAIRSEGYSFQIKLKYRAFLAGFKLKEFPIEFVDRRVGKSKMSTNIIWEAIVRVPQLRNLPIVKQA